jgi:hypothetical protein
VNFKALRQQRPSQTPALTFGEMVGHEHASWHPESPGLSASIAKLKGELGEVMRLQIEIIRAGRLAWVEQAKKLAEKQTLKELQQFSRGYSLAIQKGTIDDTGHPIGASLSWEICSIMFSHLQFVPRLKNTRELFEWLQSQIGKARLKDSNGHKRVEKYCERIKLSFGPPGRPKKL